MDADRLVLAGVAVSFIIMAGANALIFLGDPKARHTVVFWMLGGLGLAQWEQLVYPLTVKQSKALKGKPQARLDIFQFIANQKVKDSVHKIKTIDYQDGIIVHDSLKTRR